MFLVADTQRENVANLLNADARMAAEQIQNFLQNAVGSLKWIDDLDEPGTPTDYSAIHDAGYRLMRRVPSVIEVRFFDGQGCERLTISRLQPDTGTACETLRTDTSMATMFASTRASGVVYSDVFFPDGSEPHLYIGIASRGRNTGALVAEINLKAIHDSVTAIHVGSHGFAFVVDASGHLIAHPDESLVLKRTQLPEGFPNLSSEAGLHFATDLTGDGIVTASLPIEGPVWRVIVEQPITEALVPVYSALLSTGALVLAAIVSSLIAGAIVAKWLVRPLSKLRDGAAQIAAGDLTTRLSVSTGDEIEQVAEEFNRMAGALSDSYAHLEAKVVERTSALYETTQRVQLQATQLGELNSALKVSLEDAQRRKQDADRANAAKTRFLAVASHDLRQPMHAVSLLVGVLSERIRYPEVSNIVKKVQGSVDAMSELFNSLLDVSKLDAGVIHPTFETFPVADVLDRVKRSFEPLAEEKGLALSVAESSAIIRTDAALLERIISNLVSNGIRYTNQGSVLMHCCVRDDTLQITVEDTGIGIAQQYHAVVFDEFFQISNPEINRSKGLGLGLSIVKRCADLLGLSISMESGPSGSQFHIDVPYVGSAENVCKTTANARAVSERLASSFVVVVDDDKDSRFATEATYRLWGCRVLAAESTEELMESLKEHLRPPDLIVSDYHLATGCSGVAAIEAVRSYAESTTPAIILTGETGSLQIGELRGAWVVLKKPASSEHLKKVSEELLENEMPENS